jgi:hypothetical protein
VATGGEVGRVDDLNSFSVRLSPYAGMFLLIGDRDEDVAGVERP